MSLKSTGGTVKVYTVNGAAGQVPDFVQRKSAKGKQKATEDTQLKLIQDFDFPETSCKIRSSRDGRYLLATGTYKPRMKVFELDELSMKFARTTDAENVDFQILSDDWTKTIHLQSDRSVELHNQSSAFYRTRIPKAGRALAYHYPSCDALVGGLGGHVYRLNLEQGRFMVPFALQGNAEEGSATPPDETDDLVIGVNAIDINPAHQLISLGTETSSGQGTVEFWDHRARKRIGLLKLPYNKLSSSTSSAASQLPGLAELHPNDASLARAQVGVTALATRSDGLNLAVGTSTGHTLLYDLRTTRPYVIKDQGYGLPMKKLEWPSSNYTNASEGALVASADSKVVKIWSSLPEAAGRNVAAINPAASINDMHIYPDSGLICLANEQPAMTACYVPALGQAPKWCRFLDNMTEEMEDNTLGAVYEDYKFVDRKELESLKLDHLVGTDALRPYMHGYIMDLPVYQKARAAARPFEYAEHRQRLIAERLDKERESRIRSKGGKAALPSASRTLASGDRVTVNKTLADRLASGKEPRKRKRAAGEDAVVEGAANLLEDDRFGSLFTNPDFAIDERSREFAMVNPSAADRQRRRPVEEEDEEEAGQAGGEVDGQAGEDGQDGSESDSGDDLVPFHSSKPPRKRDVQQIRNDSASGPTLQSGRNGSAGLNGKKGKALGDLNKRSGRTTSRGQKLQRTQQEDRVRVVDGGLEMSFEPSRKRQDADDSERKAKSAATKRKQDEIGIGMQKGRGPEEEHFEGDQRSGRSTRRTIERSGSKNAFKKHRPNVSRR